MSSAALLCAAGEETGLCVEAGCEGHTEDELSPEEGNGTLPLSAILCAVLFVSSKPLSTQALADAAKAPVADVEEAIAQIRDLFNEQVHGFCLMEIAGAWQLRTNPEAARYIQRLIPPRAKRLSRAAAETLAVIAYKQPVQRAEIEAIRGVDALPTLKTLLDAKLIRIVGRADSAGHPALYGTTTAFLEKFGLRDLADLPTVRELEQLASEPGESEEEETGENGQDEIPATDSSGEDIELNGQR
jgi:segregation and condensation protein B